MKEYVVRTSRIMQLRSFVAFKGGAETVEYDFSPWAELNGNVTSVVWTVKSGTATIGNKTLSSNVAQGVITTSEVGASLIQVKATAGQNTYVTDLEVLAKEAYRDSDY